MTDEEYPLQFAELVDDAEGAARLIRERPAFWEWALFGSELVRRMATLRPEIHQHRIRYAPPCGEEITDLDELYTLVDDTRSEVQQLATGLDSYLRSPCFTDLFGTSTTDPDPDGIIGAAATVIEFYLANLRLAQRVRGIKVPRRFAGIIENTAHLVDRSLGGVDRFITELVGTVDLLPSLSLASGGDPLCHVIPFDLHMDNALLARIIGQLARARRNYIRAIRWNVISHIARTPVGNRLGAWLFD